jgi:predicted dehydrogenase
MSLEETTGCLPAPPPAQRQIGVGMLGYAFMGRAHSSAYRRVEELAAAPLRPRLVAIAGRDPDAVSQAAGRYGWQLFTTDWRDVVADPTIELFDNSGPNHMHAEPTIAAALSGKHVLCEKPLGRTAEESFEVWQAVAAAGVKHMCGFNYRFVPAMRLAREMVDAGELGEIRHFRATYLQDWGGEADLAGWRFDPDSAGAGALVDLATHAVDLAHYLVGDIAAVSGASRTFVPGRRVDDAVAAVAEFAAGAIGTIEVSRLSLGHRNALRWELEGSRSSLAFDLERLNELRVLDAATGRLRGYKTVLASDAAMPFASWWWPPGHAIGWEHTFVHEICHLLDAIASDGDVAPHGATFEDGYRAAVVCEAIRRSAELGQRQRIAYATIGGPGRP